MGLPGPPQYSCSVNPRALLCATPAHRGECESLCQAGLLALGHTAMQPVASCLLDICRVAMKRSWFLPAPSLTEGEREFSGNIIGSS